MHRNLTAVEAFASPPQSRPTGSSSSVDLQMADSTMSWRTCSPTARKAYTKDDEGRPLVDSQEYLTAPAPPNSHN